MRAKLTNGSVERFTCRPGRRWDVLWDTEVKGFGLRVSEKTSTRTYFFQFRVKGSGKERNVTIGRHSDPYVGHLEKHTARYRAFHCANNGGSGAARGGPSVSVCERD
jgi:hypothetical protein